ncbi:YihY/virulence factor BrkB family protein [Salinisphaera orenii]|uniref:YihY/virulence factor BrkB family protein n=1 Tax=Salinisphaera orenii TaxID=856731 RepID=UPI000DBE6BB9
MRELWRFIARVVARVREHRLSLVAAGMAFYAMLSIFPALTVIISVYGLVADPATVSHQITMLPANLPPALTDIVAKQVRDISQGSGVALSLGLVVSVAFATYSSSKSTRALVAAMNIAYNVSDNRGFIRFYLHTIALTFAGVLLVIGLLALIGLSGLLKIAHIGYWPALLISFVRWFLMLVLMTTALGAVYAFAPYRRPPRWRWLTPGAALATVFWLLASLGFSFYISQFGNYNKIYGSTSALMVLMIWLALSAFIVLIGAEVNAEFESSSENSPQATNPLNTISALVREKRG